MKNLSKQQGIALLVIVTLLATAAAAVTVTALNRSSQNVHIARDKITAAALAQAKEALIGYAVSVDLSSSTRRPGDLPCPDTNNDGITETSCGSGAGSYQERRLGRLPWKTLGLPDLRDGNGERLWYAVSNNFKYSTRTACTSTGQTGCLNSDTVGTINVLAPDGTTRLNDGGGSTGAVAVILASGDAITRQDNIAQTRGCTPGVDCDATDKDKCITASPTTVPKCNPLNYLDTALGEDNANFTDSSSTNGFIQGKIKDIGNNVILNDQLLVITQEDIMRPIQKRVAGEVRNCLTDYAAHNYNRYPWAVPITDLSTTYDDSSDTYFGRIPDDLGNTESDSGGQMNDQWEIICNTHTAHTPSPWWINWKEMVFYGLANGYKPVNPPTATPSCPTCITVNPPSSAADKKFVVIVADKILTTTIPPQVRTSSTDKRTLSNYLEDANKIGASPFSQGTASNTFNDVVVYQ